MDRETFESKLKLVLSDLTDPEPKAAAYVALLAHDLYQREHMAILEDELRESNTIACPYLPCGGVDCAMWGVNPKVCTRRGVDRCSR